MERLGRFPLSVVLSFLEEADGVALLSTKKVYYTNLLPMFRVATPSGGGGGGQQPSRVQRRKYWFRVVPVHDVTTRLARLNTARLYRRRRGQGQGRIQRVGLTTSQQAQIEWREQRRTLVAPFPPHLELLRLKDDDDCDPTTTTKTTSSLLPTTTMRMLHGDSGGKRNKNPILLLASYPRSGNTLVRSLWEAVTNVITGSDTRPDRPLSQQLNFVGEGHTTTTTNNKNSSALPFLCKTHWPERHGCYPIVASAVIVLVRNPYDAIDSYWNMNATCTHTETVVDAVYRQYRHFLDCLVRNEIQVWLEYLTYWERQRQDRGVNVLFIRYEDVLRDPAGQVTQMLQFAIQQRHRHNNNNNNRCVLDDEFMPLSEFWQHRIRHAISGKSAGSFGVYRPRTIHDTNNSSSFGKSLKRYSRELLNYMEDTAEQQRSSDDPQLNHQFLRRFGYSIRYQNFPANFVGSGEPPRQGLADVRCRSITTTTTIPTITINVGDNDHNDSMMMIRPRDCPFGRNLQAWRHSVTDHDRSPLPTVPKKQPPQQTTTP